MQMLEFVIELTTNHYLNFSNIILCLPITFRKTSNKAQAIDGDTIPVNNFFAHRIKDVNIKRYGDSIAVLPINKTLDIYRYSEAMLKHLPDDVLKTFQGDILYSKNPVIIKGNTANTINDRRNHIAAAARNSNTDNNIDDRIAKFNADNALSGKKVFRIPLKYLVDIGLVNLLTAFNVKFVFNLQQTLAKLFQSRKKLPNTAAGAAVALPTTEPDANVYFHAIPFCNMSRLNLMTHLTST